MASPYFLCRQQCCPGILPDLAVRVQLPENLEGPDGFFGRRTELAVRGFPAGDNAATAGVAVADQERLGVLHRIADRGI